MSKSNPLRWAALFGLLGLGAATWLFLKEGVGAVWGAFAAAGFGILWSSLFHLVPMAINARAWQLLLPRVTARSNRLSPAAPRALRRPSAALMFRAVWLREAVNGLLPVARVGGEVAAAQLLIEHKMRPPVAAASLVVDMSVSLVTESIFVIAGLAMLAAAAGRNSVERDIVLGLLVSLPLIAGFFAVQRYGAFNLVARLIRHLFGRRFQNLVLRAVSFDRVVRRLYRRRRGVIGCTLWQLAGWIVGAGEIYLALVFLGARASLATSLVIESLIQGLSAGAFVVPGALGVQEGGFLALGELLGYAPEVALALALMRRARDLVIFLPAVVVWQISLGRRLLREAPAPAAPAKK